MTLPSLRTLRLALAALAATAALSLAGCGGMVTTATGTNFAPAAGVSGTVHGGNQIITGATVNLYSVGTTGYGSAGTLLATTTTDNVGANFAFTQVGTQPGTLGSAYACPTSTTLIYLVISGGNTLNTGVNNNAAAAFLVPVGPCAASASQTFSVTETTTVAAVWALQQYINPGTTTPGSMTLGSPSSTQGLLGISNAFKSVSNLTNLTNGFAVTANTQTGTGTNITGTATVTVTPEAGKVNLIADILAACVNTSAANSTNCGTLFTNAVPPSPTNTSQPGATFNTAVDTIQAAYYMATNPTDGGTTALGNLFGIAGGTGAPFQPTSAQPTDWTIGVVYSTTAASTCTSGGTFIDYGYDIGIDASGNVWISNGAATNSAMSQISPLGKPLACSGVVGASRGGAAIDTAGNVWAASGLTASAGTPSPVIKFDGTTTTTINLPSTTANKAYAIAPDGSGNVFITDATGLLLYELPSTATAATVPTLIGPVTGASPFHIAVDTKGTVIVGQSGSSGTSITAYAPTLVGGSTYPNSGTTITQATAYAGVYGIAFDSTGAFWVGNSAGTSATASTGPGNTTSSTPLTFSSVTPGDPNVISFGTPTKVTPIFAGGLSTGRVVAIDGANKIWIPNNSSESSTSYALSVFDNNGTALSPTSVTAGTGTTSTTNGGFQKAATVFAGLRGVAIDPSGNVWVTNTASTGNLFITEVVGAAVPVVTPLSAAIAAKKLGQKP